MNLTSLSAVEFKNIVKLLEEKEALNAKIAKVDAALAAYQGAPVVAAPAPARTAVAKASAKAPVKRARRARRGSTKIAIIDLVKSAGKGGITVKEVAAKLGVPANRVYTWFYATGKSVKEIKKVGEAKYAWAA